MKKAEEVKERIVAVTIALIQNSKGNVSEITTREIAEKAAVGNGLIHYHFQTKENLIAICVQRIISQVVDGFKPEIAQMQNPQERITHATTRVFEFLFANPAISRISILGDFVEPSCESNTVKSQQSICYVLGDCMSDTDKKIFSYVLVAAMQSAFLASQCGDAMLGYALDTPTSREAYIKKLVDILFHGINAQAYDEK